MSAPFADYDPDRWKAPDPVTGQQDTRERCRARSAIWGEPADPGLSRTDRAELGRAWDHASWETGEIKHGTDLRTAFEAGWQAKARVLVGQQERLREALERIGDPHSHPSAEVLKAMARNALPAASPEPEGEGQ